MNKSFIVENENNMRIDRYLAETSEGLYRSNIKKLIKDVDITVNYKPVK